MHTRSRAQLARIVRAGGSVGIDGSVIGNGNASAAANANGASAHGEADELAVSRAIGDANYKRDPSRPLAEQVHTCSCAGLPRAAGCNGTVLGCCGVAVLRCCSLAWSLARLQCATSRWLAMLAFASQPSASRS